MDDGLTRLAFRVQGGDREAARALLVEARERQHAAAFERAAKALGGGAAVLTVLDEGTPPEERARVRALLPPPAEAAAMFTPTPVDLEAIDRIGPSALITAARWAIEGLHAVPRYGSGVPYVGAALVGPWVHVAAAFGGRVESPWIALRVVAEVDPAKRGLTDAILKSFFATYGDRGAVAAEALLAHEAPLVRRHLWTKLLSDHPSRIDDPSLAGLLDEPATRELATALLLRRGPGAARHALPFLHAAAPATRRAVASLLATIGDADAVPFLRQAAARERDARTRVQMTVALERISGAEPLVGKTEGGDVAVLRARAALAAPRPPRPPAWLADAPMPELRWRDGVPLRPAEVHGLTGRLSLLGPDHVDPFVADARAALEVSSARALLVATREAFVAARERRVFPAWILHASMLLLPEIDVDRVCEEVDESLRTSARERWRRGPSGVELAWDPEAVAGSPRPVAFAWHVHWAERAPKRRDRDRAQRALAVATRQIPESERVFAHLRRFGLDDDGVRRFVVDPGLPAPVGGPPGDDPEGEAEATELVVRVRPGGAIVVTGPAGEPVLRLPADDLGRRVKAHVTDLEEALLDARRTLAEAYADKLVVEVRFVRALLLHPLWRPIAQGCVLRREAGGVARSAATETLRMDEESLRDLSADERVRFVLSQVEG